MNKANVLKFLNGTKATLSKHSPAILIGFAILGGGTAVVLAVRDTPKALKRIEEKKTEYQVDKLSPWETVKTTWPCYVPTAIAFTFAAGCAIGSQSIHVKRNAALAAAYKISETALIDYRGKVLETIGEKKEQTVRDKVAQEQVIRNPVVPQNVIRTGRGSTLFLDPLSMRYFESDVEDIRRAENKLNKNMLQSICGSTSVNDFYAEIGLDAIDESIGYGMGWNSEHQIDLDIRPAWTNDERTSCLVIGHYNKPKYDY